MGRFFKIFQNLSQNWLRFKKILEKSCDFAQNVAPNRADWYMNGSLFLENIGIYMGLLSKSVAAIPTKTKLENLPGS